MVLHPGSLSWFFNAESWSPTWLLLGSPPWFSILVLYLVYLGGDSWFTPWCFRLVPHLGPASWFLSWFFDADSWFPTWFPPFLPWFFALFLHLTLHFIYSSPTFADGLLPPSPWPFLSHLGSVPWFCTLVLHLGSPCLNSHLQSRSTLVAVAIVPVILPCQTYPVYKSVVSIYFYFPDLSQL